MTKNTLEIICEILYENRAYFKDVDDNIYTVAPGIHPPKSPIVSYKIYNNKSYYKKIDNPELLKTLYEKFEK